MFVKRSLYVHAISISAFINQCCLSNSQQGAKPLALKIKHHGPHALRHTCATHLINEGVSLKEISDHLGHQGLETTRIYTKVDLVSLR